ncbi:hypothetical protein B0H14DRAFT_2339502, partial [Mycena olivaceomarginata]
RFARRSDRFMDAYRKGLDGVQGVWASKRYRGHRVLPKNIMELFDKIFKKLFFSLSYGSQFRHRIKWFLRLDDFCRVTRYVTYARDRLQGVTDAYLMTLSNCKPQHAPNLPTTMLEVKQAPPEISVPILCIHYSLPCYTKYW